MEKQTDLRVIKTRRGIKQAFLSLINKKELSKITIIELAKQAEINKGTFYLHYEDIYALYRETLAETISERVKNYSYYGKLLVEPEVFVRGFFTISYSNDEANEALFYPENLRYEENYLTLMIAAIIDAIYQTKTIAVEEFNTMRLEFIVGGMFMHLIQKIAAPVSEELVVSEETITYLVNQIYASFPEFFRS
ncbi:TetR/AcrR family transcriptional regulator [Enterococcus hulanensis]|uniref:TetR/AcrR family transcriptional regulator n=1 Tax=Enterococcus TaxID=1350 RepID=UPI000B5A4025|nr:MULTISPECIES: TetR/AcrR family transcriptional regulator [Enterococcus]MBO0412399.1 TetR/AcrR family transcriptional regulator [Enterococcus hulanensis]OTO20620.1 hypothetical protein A5875_001973 [Enterococcus sp. 3H8_DIV0648]